jgi:hypothetical protein
MPATDVMAAPSKAATRSPHLLRRPVCVAAAYTILLRVVYGIYGAWLCDRLYFDPRLVNSNSFTDHLIPRGDRLLYATLGLWERFDTLWYIHIAQYGYDRPAAIVFYPLYPWLIRGFAWAIHPPLAAALVVSTLAAFFFFWGIQRLVELDDPGSMATRTLLIAGVWPASFILFAGYAEAQVLAFTVWSIYFARQGRWHIAGLLGMGAGASKAVGCFVAVPLAFLGYKEKTWRAWTAFLTLVPPLLFAIWTRHAGFGSASDVYPKFWAVTVQFPLVTLAQCAVRFLAGGLDLLFKLNFASLAIVGALSLARRMRTEYKLYAIAVILLFLTKNADPLLNETLRYVLVVFPAFLGLASLVRRPLGVVLLSVILVLIHGVLLLKFFEWSLVA